MFGEEIRSLCFVLHGQHTFVFVIIGRAGGRGQELSEQIGFGHFPVLAVKCAKKEK